MMQWYGMKGNGKGMSTGKCKIEDVMYLLKWKLPSRQDRGEESSIYIAGLPEDTTDLDLYKIFAVFGSIHINGVKTMRSEDGKTCKGIGFVNYIDAGSAQA